MSRVWSWLRWLLLGAVSVVAAGLWLKFWAPNKQASVARGFHKAGFDRRTKQIEMDDEERKHAALRSHEAEQRASRAERDELRRAETYAQSPEQLDTYFEALLR